MSRGGLEGCGLFYFFYSRSQPKLEPKKRDASKSPSAAKSPSKRSPSKSPHPADKDLRKRSSSKPAIVEKAVTSTDGGAVVPPKAQGGRKKNAPKRAARRKKSPSPPRSLPLGGGGRSRERTSKSRRSGSGKRSIKKARSNDQVRPHSRKRSTRSRDQARSCNRRSVRSHDQARSRNRRSVRSRDQARTCNRGSVRSRDQARARSRSAPRRSRSLGQKHMLRPRGSRPHSRDRERSRSISRSRSRFRQPVLAPYDLGQDIADLYRCAVGRPIDGELLKDVVVTLKSQQIRRSEELSSVTDHDVSILSTSLAVKSVVRAVCEHLQCSIQPGQQAQSRQRFPLVVIEPKLKENSWQHLTHWAKPSREEVDFCSSRKAALARSSPSFRSVFIYVPADTEVFTGVAKAQLSKTAGKLLDVLVRISRAGHVAECWASVGTNPMGWWLEYFRVVSFLSEAVRAQELWSFDARFRKRLEDKQLRAAKVSLWKELDAYDDLLPKETASSSNAAPSTKAQPPKRVPHWWKNDKKTKKNLFLDKKTLDYRRFRIPSPRVFVARFRFLLLRVLHLLLVSLVGFLAPASPRACPRLPAPPASLRPPLLLTPFHPPAPLARSLPQ